MDFAAIRLVLSGFILGTLKDKTAPVRREAAKLLRALADQIDKETPDGQSP